jgi:hypothetical protein
MTGDQSRAPRTPSPQPDPVIGLNTCPPAAPQPQPRVKMPRSRAGQRSRSFSPGAVLASLMAASPALVAGACIPLSGSTACPAFQTSSVSTGSLVVGYFPFMQSVTDVSTFDELLQEYVQTTYVQEKYQARFGCGNIDISNTTELYARFTITTVCNSIIQNSISDCSLTAAESEPVCADTCVRYTRSLTP